MKRVPFSTAAKYTTAIWFVVVIFYGWYSVSNMMAYLRENPSMDLYANSLGFQILAFALTKGLASVLILGLLLLAEASLLKTNEGKNE